MMLSGQYKRHFAETPSSIFGRVNQWIASLILLTLSKGSAVKRTRADSRGSYPDDWAGVGTGEGVREKELTAAT